MENAIAETRCTRWLHRRLHMLGLLLIVSACGMPDRTDIAVPPNEAHSFRPPGLAPVTRFYGDTLGSSGSIIEDDLRSALLQRREEGQLDILAVSGGGPDGAFGAGVLTGWTATGDRPEFDIVTGISTGAIIAPFAFLGPNYDDELARFYTETQTRDVMAFRTVGAVLGAPSIATNHRLEAVIARELTNEHISAIASEHLHGRRLYIGTTDFNAGRPVIWDIGAIASIETEAAYDLVRSIILASASAPIIFEPIRIAVTDGAEIREELHVDGALLNQVFLYPEDLPMGRLLAQSDIPPQNRSIWIIHNRSLDPRYEVQSAGLGMTIQRHLELQGRGQALGDLTLLLALAERDRMNLRVIFIPEGFEQRSAELFDQTYMAALFEVGREASAVPENWLRSTTIVSALGEVP